MGKAALSAILHPPEGMPAEPLPGEPPPEPLIGSAGPDGAASSLTGLKPARSTQAFPCSFLHSLAARTKIIEDQGSFRMAIRNRRQHKNLWAWMVLLIGAPLYLYLNLFAFPNIPFHLDGDQTFFWTYALRMLHGERIYRDFFQFTPPGTDLFFLTLFKFLGPRLWVMNAAVLVLGMALCWICFSIAAQLMDDGQAIFAVFLVLVLAYGRLLDATHHWFSLLAALCAVRIVMPERTLPRIAIAGALLGVASFFTQTAGVAGAIALLVSLAWEGFSHRRPWRVVLGRQFLLLTVFGLVLCALNAWLLVKVGWRQLWYFQAVFPERYVEYGRQSFFPGLPASFTPRTLPDLARRMFVYVLLLVIYPSVLWYCWRERRRDAALLNAALLSLLGLMLLLEVITRTNWTRIYAVSPPALILLTWVVTRSVRTRRSVLTAGWTIVLCLAAVQTWSRHQAVGRMIELPAGKTVLSGEKYEKFSWLMQHTKPGDFFYQALWVNVYPPLELRSPVFVDVLVANQVTRPEFVALILQQLESRQVRYILWSPMLNDPLDPGRPWEDHLGPLRAYMRSRYTRVRVFSDQDEIWERQ
jgi:hypothetical protein